MHPGMFYRWKRAQAAAREAWGGCHPGGHHSHGDGAHAHAGGRGHGGGAGFGVRRPLRFMAHKLGLDDEQVAELARILSDIKNERAQGAVDDERAVSAFADAIEGDSFDRAKAEEGGKLRVGSAERLRDEVLRTLERTHAMLTPEQRKQLAYMLRSGALTI